MTLRVALHRLLLIGDRFTDPTISARIIDAVKSGVQWVQLRDHDADTETFFYTAQELVGKLRSIRPDLLISINSRLAVAEKLGCAIHLRICGPREEASRMLIPEGFPVGISVHSFHEIEDTHSDYLIWSPVFETTSKPGQRGTGLKILSNAAHHAYPIPVIAMGGITPDRVKPCLEAGAYGVAVLSGILGVIDTRSAVSGYLDAFNIGAESEAAGDA